MKGKKKKEIFLHFDVINLMERIIQYRNDIKPDTESIIRVYQDAGLNRPIHELNRIEQMYMNSNLIVSAWHNNILIGIARSLTDYSFCCYLSDLAVCKKYQCMGVGKKLIELTKEYAGDSCMLLLLSAPSAMNYYPKMGFQKAKNAFLQERIR